MDEEEPVACRGCKAPVDPMDLFPGGRCLDCHAEATPPVSAAELVAMWSDGRMINKKESK